MDSEATASISTDGVRLLSISYVVDTGGGVTVPVRVIPIICERVGSDRA